MPKTRQELAAVGIMVSLLASTSGCNSSSSSSGARVCEPGEAIACISSTGCHGYKRCIDSGMAYESCDCGLADGGATGTAGASSSAAGNSSGGTSASTSSGGGTPSGGSGIGNGGNTRGGAFATSNGGLLSAGTSSAAEHQGGSPSSGGNSASGSTGTSSLPTSVAGSSGTGGTLGTSGETSIDGGTSGASARAGSAGAAANGGSAGSAGTRRPAVCDAGGQNCKCLNLASFGAIASHTSGVGVDGLPNGTTAFETWLSEKSNAVVTMYKTRQTLTKELLDGLDVVLLQNLTGWTFSAEEQQAFADWVNAGGGVISLSGYVNNDDLELAPTNMLLASTGMSYFGGGVSGSVPGGTCSDNSQTLCPQASSPCCYCWNNAIPVTAWTAGHPVAKDVKAIGAYMGRQVNPGTATIVATYDGKPVAASKGVGLGRAFLWCDDTITYTSQWSGGQKSGNPDQWNPCYNAATSQWLTADVVFQTKQFWYNAIRYVAPLTDCDFMIKEPEVILL